MGSNKMSNQFLVTFGPSSNMKVLDYIVDLEVDCTLSDISEGTNLSRKTVDKILKLFLKSEIVQITRTVGSTKMYQINKTDSVAKKISEINDLIIKKTQAQAGEGLGSEEKEND